MASSKTGPAVINLEESEQIKSELQFQDFGHGDTATLETSDYNEPFPGAADLENENAGLLEEKKRSTFWEFSYYQSFFDVDTDEVVERIIWSMLPVKRSFLDRVVRGTPDLYGPFWISTTLIFSIAISANIAQYFMTEGQDKRIWHYDFRKVSIAATVIYSYVFLLPLALWGLMWYRRSYIRYTFLEILCVYGYSIFIYIPISILWLIQVSWFQWTLVIIGAGLSGLVLAHTFWPTVRDESKRIAALALVLILLFHALLAVGFVTFFFRPSHPSAIHPTTTISVETPQTTKEKLVSLPQKISGNDTPVKASITGTKSPNIPAENQVIKRKVTSHNTSSVSANLRSTEANQATQTGAAVNNIDTKSLVKATAGGKLSPGSVSAANVTIQNKANSSGHAAEGKS